MPRKGVKRFTDHLYDIFDTQISIAPHQHIHSNIEAFALSSEPDYET